MGAIFCIEKEVMMKYFRWVLVLVAILGLIGVRMVEDVVFYDPLLRFFKGNFREMTFPEIEIGKHLLSVSFRYVLNTALSLLILFLIFKKSFYLKVSGAVYLFFLVTLLPVYYYFIETHFELGFTAGFYVRRILIQPLLLLILIPAFWYAENKRT